MYKTTVCTGTRYQPTYLTLAGTARPRCTQIKRENALILPTSPEPVCVCFYPATHSFHFLTFFVSLQRVYKGISSSHHVFLLCVQSLSSRITHLMQLPQENMREVKGGEAYSYRDGSFDPVHTETFIESTDNPFFRNNFPHGA